MSTPIAKYSYLGDYTTRAKGSVQAPISFPGTLADLRLMPEFGSCGNNVLSHGMGNNAMNDGYFSLCQAYPNCADSCTKYVKQVCGTGDVNNAINLGGLQN